MPLAFLTFAIFFVVLAGAGLSVFHAQSIRRRLGRVVAEPVAAKFHLDEPPPDPAAKVAKFLDPFQKVLPRSTEETSVVERRLARAGYREKLFVNVFYGAKVLAPILLCVLATVSGLYAFTGFFIYLMALGLGFLIPDFWLGHRIKARQASLRLGLPDALDLIIICVEAGLGVERAVLRAAHELRLSQPALADELSLVSAEQRVGQYRANAWKNFAERTDVESIRALAGILIQAEKFGTSIGKTLRVHADALRTRRRQEAQEQAAKTTVKLLFPLVLLIFPALFVVTLGPSMIGIFESMKDFFN